MMVKITDGQHRKRQQHRAGLDLLRSTAAPAIRPAGRTRDAALLQTQKKNCRLRRCGVAP